YNNNSLFAANMGGGQPQQELNGHPANFNVFDPGPGALVSSQRRDRTFDIAGNLGPLMLLPDNAQLVDVLNSSDLGKLCQNNFSSMYLRRLVTTYSFDVDRPGMSPYIWDPAAAPFAMLAYDPANPLTWSPQGNAI